MARGVLYGPPELPPLLQEDGYHEALRDRQQEIDHEYGLIGSLKPGGVRGEEGQRRG